MIPVLACRFLAIAEGNLDLPSFAGSTIRGHFGRALLRAACERPGRCPPCQVAHCSYRYLFETHGPRAQEVPRPFILLLPNRTGLLSPGTRFHLGFRLFGPAVEHLGLLVHCLESLGSQGMGPSQGRFRLVSGQVERPSGPSVFYGHGEISHEPEPSSLADWTPALGSGVERLEVQLLSPTRLVHRGELVVAAPPFAVLLRAVLRRLNLMLTNHGGGALEVDSRGLLEAAEAIQIARSRLEWQDYRRYSNRQERPVQTGGLVGSLLYQGDLSPFLPWLAYGSVLNVGKATTFGMGALRLRIPVGA